jgi:ribokinase
MIVVSSGANRRFTVDLIPVETLLTAALIVMQLEIPLPTVAAAADLAASAGIPVLLNCAPVQPLPDHLLGQIQYLVANKSEAEALSGCSIQQPQDALLAARNLRQRGISTVVITLGAQGSVWVSADGEGHCLAYAVPVIDTTAAGDGFCGALAVRLAEGAPLPQALRFASAAAALAVTRSGAQPSLAQRSEIEHLLTTGSVLDLPIA